MNHRILLTGASGFVGRNCLRPLVERGYEVHALGATRIGPSQPGVKWRQADLFDRDQVARLIAESQADTLLHLAWNAKPGQAYQSPENYTWVTSSLDLVQRFVENGGQRVVVAGTCYEYDQAYGWLHEQRTPLNPDTPYGVCKNALRQMLSAYCASAGVSFSWPRIFFLYGPHENPHRLAASVVRSLLQGQRAACSHGRQIRDFMYVEDLADALVELCQSKVEGAINLGSGAPLTIAELVKQVGDQMERPELIGLGDLPPRPSEAPLVAADTTRQREVLGWTPRYTTAEAIHRTIAWWRSQIQEVEEQHA